MSGSTPDRPGWYPDGEGRQRWFDGNAWTDHVQQDSGGVGAAGAGPDDAGTPPRTAEFPTMAPPHGTAPPTSQAPYQPPAGWPGQSGQAEQTGQTGQTGPFAQYGQVPPPPPGPYGAPGQGAPGNPSLEVGGGTGLKVGLAVAGVLALIVVVVGGVMLLLAGGDEDSDPAVDETASETVVPSDAPTAPSELDLPTIDPSDFPTELPSDFPSIEIPELEDLLSDLPTEFPTDFPEFPTNPEDWDSWFSEYLEDLTP